MISMPTTLICAIHALEKFFKNEQVAASSESDLFTNKNVPHSISKSNLIMQQHEDPEISALFQKSC